MYCPSETIYFLQKITQVLLAKVQDDALISIELGKTWKYKNRMELYKVDIIWVDSPAYPNFCKKKSKKKKPRKIIYRTSAISTRGYYSTLEV